jgi:hypothetical protein
MKLEKYLSDLARQLSDHIGSLLKEHKTSADKQKVLVRYITAIHPHFIIWVTAMYISAKTSEARMAALDNLKLEISENHQAMLFNFMEQMNILPCSEEYERLFPVINKVQNTAAKLNSVTTATVIYLLEESSKVFIPWIEEVAVSLQASDLTYTRKHGEADDLHARQALNAVLYEANESTEPMFEVQKAAAVIIELLNAIFSPTKS